LISDHPIHWTDPSSWPWIVYLWLPIFLFGWLKPLWRWIQRRRAASWPTTTGEIQSVSVDEAKRFFISTTPRGKSQEYVAELGYRYSLAGVVEAGFYKRDSATEEEAEEFVRALKGKPVLVQYNPHDQSKSTLSDASIESLLQARPPKPDDGLFAPTLDSVPGVLRPLLWPLVGLSVVGLVLSLWVHLGAVMGRRVAPEVLFYILHIGIFVVWIPAVFAGKALVGSVNRKDFWKVVLKNSPDGMRYLVYIFFGYAFINFAFFFFQAPTGSQGSNLPAVVWRGFSGHWMAFYSAAMVILYSAAKAGEGVRRCVNGHAVSPGANFCTRCGQSVIHT
jgi:hypothetical protein